MKWIFVFVTALLPLCSWASAIVSAYAIDSRTGKVLLDKNSDLSCVPASCMKIVTTGAALQILGADAHFETVLEYDGEIDEARMLHGNLYIRGGGDPTLGSPRGTLDWKEQIVSWAEAIEKLGIVAVSGRIVADSSKWETAMAVPSWQWEDLGNYYGAGASALSFHENSYSLVFKPGKKLGEATDILRTEPPLGQLELHNAVTTGAEGSGDQATIFGSEFSWLRYVRGTIPLGTKEFAIRGAVSDSTEWIENLLKEELSRRKIMVREDSLPLCPTRKKLHTTVSPQVGEIVYWTNQKSVNLYAEHLLKKMGEVVYGFGSTENGIRAVTEFWKGQNLVLDGFVMADGSGLSRKNIITCQLLVQMLVKLKTSTAFLHSLPERMGGVKAKSGTMSYTKAIAGYRGDVVFAVIVNNCAEKNMNALIEQLIDEIPL